MNLSPEKRWIPPGLLPVEVPFPDRVGENVLATKTALSPELMLEGGTCGRVIRSYYVSDSESLSAT